MTRRLIVPAVTLALLAFPSVANAAEQRSKRVQPRKGEGVIAITARVCGSSASWRTVARANGITGPQFVVRLGQALTVSCAAPRPSSGPTTSTRWAYPLARRGACMSGWGAGRGHKGVDLDGRMGDPIRAVAAGTVTRVGWVWSGYGRSVVIAHGGYWSHYAHQSRIAVHVGQKVRAGQVIGYVGNSGHVIRGKGGDGSHLHLEIATAARVIGAQVNPAVFLRARGIRVC